MVVVILGKGKRVACGRFISLCGSSPSEHTYHTFFTSLAMIVDIMDFWTKTAGGTLETDEKKQSILRSIDIAENASKQQIACFFSRNQSSRYFPSLFCEEFVVLFAAGSCVDCVRSLSLVLNYKTKNRKQKKTFRIVLRLLFCLLLSTIQPAGEQAV